MHPCLSVQEILWIIFDSLLNDAPSRENTATVISLATTCHTFEDMALDVLWRTQVNLVPLIKCMPKDLWKELPATGFDRRLSFTRDLAAKDFSRFDFYARRIIHLKYLPYGWHGWQTGIPYDLDLCHKIQLYLKQQDGGRKNLGLLPNLRRIVFNNRAHASFALKFLLGEQTMALSLGFREEIEVDVKSLFALIKSRAPRVESLDIEWGGILPTIECTDLSKLVCSLKGLRGLATKPRSLNTPAIRHLASMPYLHSLKFPNSSTKILEALSLVSPHPFKALRHLEMSGASLDRWPVLLARLQPHQLESIVLNFDALPSTLEVQDFVLALSETSARSGLRTVRLNQSWRSQTAKVSAQTVIDFGILEPLLAFNNLTTLHIALVCDIALDDSNIIQMAKSWPKLQNLQLGCNLGWGNPSAATHRSLLALVAECPNLETLMLSFDASELKGDSPEIVPEAINTKIKYLNVGDSAIVEPAGVARLLSVILPKVEGIGGAWRYNGAGAFTQPQRSQHRMWQDVAELLQESQRMVTPFTESGMPGSVEA